MKRLILPCLIATLALAPCGFAADTAAPSATSLPAGGYTLDKSHASLIFRVNHLGFSRYTAAFQTFDAALQFNPAAPASAKVEATVEVASLRLENPPEGFTQTLLGAEWLDAAKYPQISFKTTSVEVTGDQTARITGDLSLHGVTKPIVLEARYNGGYAGHPMDPNARIGFSATGSFNRSEFGIAYGIPAPGTTMGVSDQVDVMIEAEFTGPPLAVAP